MDNFKNANCYQTKHFILVWSSYLGLCFNIVVTLVETFILRRYHNLHPHNEERYRLCWYSNGNSTIVNLKYLASKENSQVQKDSCLPHQNRSSAEMDRLPTTSFSAKPAIRFFYKLSLLSSYYESLMICSPCTSQNRHWISVADIFCLFKHCMNKRFLPVAGGWINITATYY